MSYYKNKYPEINDIVIVIISKYPEKGHSIQCKLVEYDNIYGIILRTEITKRKEIEPKKIFKECVPFPVVVIDIDNNNPDNIKIDLSYIKLNDTERLNQIEIFEQKKNIYNIAIEMSNFLSIDLNIILENSMWKFMNNKKILNDLNGFYSEILENPEIFYHHFHK